MHRSLKWDSCGNDHQSCGGVLQKRWQGVDRKNNTLGTYLREYVSNVELFDSSKKTVWLRLMPIGQSPVPSLPSDCELCTTTIDPFPSSAYKRVLINKRVPAASARVLALQVAGEDPEGRHVFIGERNSPGSCPGGAGPSNTINSLRQHLVSNSYLTSQALLSPPAQPSPKWHPLGWRLGTGEASARNSWCNQDSHRLAQL